MKTSLVIALVMGVGTVALADDVATRTKAVKKLLDAQASALTGDSNDFDKTFGTTLAADPLQDLQHDLMDQAKINIGTTKIGWLGTCGWVAAESTERAETHPEIMAEQGAPSLQPPRAWHWLELVIPDGTGFKAKAVTHYRTAPDKSLADHRYNDIKALATDKSPAPLVAWLAQPAEMAKHLAKDPAVAVYGTSDKDHAYGPAAAKKLIGSWAKLELDVVAKPGDDMYKSQQIVAGDCGAASARVRMKVKGGAILLNAFAIAHKVGDGWELVALSYAAQPEY